MSYDKTPLDLSTGTYSEFETFLSNKLDLKVLLVSGWDIPPSYYSDEAAISFARTTEDWEAARKQFLKTEEAVMASLRANITERDAELGTSLTDNELRSLIQAHHVTKRAGNAEPEQAVIVFDPHSAIPVIAPVTPPAPPQAKDDKTIRIVMTPGPASASVPDDVYVLNDLFANHCSNAWAHSDDDCFLPFKSIIENVDIDAEDLRRYNALHRVLYALAHQDEYNNMGRQYSREAPRFYFYSGIDSDGGPNMFKAAYKKPYVDVFNKYKLEGHGDAKDWGLKDPDFFEKVTQASAVMSLVYNVLKPHEAFAHLHAYTNDKQIEKIRKDLEDRINTQIASHFKKPPSDPIGSAGFISNDVRILFPAFREVYEQDKSEGDQRKYMDAIMGGLQRWFPTITNAPVLTSQDPEPPREVKAVSVPQKAPASKEPPKPKA